MGNILANIATTARDAIVGIDQAVNVGVRDVATTARDAIVGIDQAIDVGVRDVKEKALIRRSIRNTKQPEYTGLEFEPVETTQKGTEGNQTRTFRSFPTNNETKIRDVPLDLTISKEDLEAKPIESQYRFPLVAVLNTALVDKTVVHGSACSTPVRLIYIHKHWQVDTDSDLAVRMRQVAFQEDESKRVGCKRRYAV